MAIEEWGVREITTIRFKRIHIASPSGDKVGHWWFEIGAPADASSESFGWWPECQLTSLTKVFTGVKGELNDGLSGSRPPRDPHHGEVGDEEFHPLVDDTDPRSDGDIAACLRTFALSYTGSWQWILGWGQNCHTFQRAALKHCRLRVPQGVRKAKL